MSLSDEEVRVAILEFLLKKGRWRARYHPLDTMARWLGKRVRRNGKELEKSLGSSSIKGIYSCTKEVKQYP